MPAPQTISVALTQAETDYIWNFVQANYPGATGPQVIAKLQEAAKEGIVSFLKQETRRVNREARRIAEQEITTALDGLEPATP